MSYCLNPSCQKPQNRSGVEACQKCGTTLLLADRYRALRPIGQGGFGRTFLAIDEYKPSRPRCVIKQFLPQGQGNAQKAAELFRQEAQQLDALGKHPQIPELLAHFDTDNRQYLVQEFIDGQNLEEELLSNGAFSEEQIREVLDDLLPVLQFIHSKQVIHRDIKPENIIRRRGGKLVLVDFGASKAMTRSSLEQTGTRIGSAGYAAPEQTIGRAVYASDLYSLGVTCIHLLTQMPPFELYSMQDGTWVWRDYLRQPISTQLAYILDAMLETATRQRYQSTEQVRRDLNSRTPSVMLRYQPEKPLPPAPPLNIDCRGERLMVAGFTVGVVVILDRLLIIPAILTIGCGLALLLYLLNRRFHAAVGVAEKFRMLDDAQRLKHQIREIEQELQRLTEKQVKLNRQNDQKVKETTLRQREYDQAENEELSRLEQTLKQQLAKLQAQQKNLGADEKAEISRTLQTQQNQYRAAQLASYTLAEAKVPGIGKALKQALQEVGIGTAAEVDWERVTQVNGVGEAKAASLVAWRQEIDTQIAATMPKSLPTWQEVAIHNAYRDRGQFLKEQEAELRRQAKRDRDLTCQRCQQQRDLLARDLREHRERVQLALATLEEQRRDHQERVNSAREALNRVQQGLEVYRQVSFGAYLRQIFWLDRAS